MFSFNKENKQGQIFVEIDANRFSEEDSEYIRKMSEILEYNISNIEGDIRGQLDLGSLKVTIIGVDTFEHKLIKVTKND